MVTKKVKYFIRMCSPLFFIQLDKLYQKTFNKNHIRQKNRLTYFHTILSYFHISLCVVIFF